MPFLSIIIPVYNKEQYLNKCIQSIVDQNFTDWELILINDGSSDSSPDICDKWSKQDYRIKLFHQQNAGVSAARNRGLKESKGEYIQFTDADDWWEAGAFEQLFKELKTYANPEIIVFGLTKIYNSGKKETIKPKRNGIIDLNCFMRNLIAEQKESGIFGFVANKLISRDLINIKNLRFNDSYTLMEDFDFFLDAYANCSKIVQSQLTGYIYRQASEKSTTDKNFVYNYPQLLQIRIKEYKYVEKVCGEIENNRKWLQDELNKYFLATFIDYKADNIKNINILLHTFEKICPSNFYYRPTGYTFNTTLISFLLRNKLIRALFYYLKIRQYIIYKCK